MVSTNGSNGTLSDSREQENGHLKDTEKGNRKPDEIPPINFFDRRLNHVRSQVLKKWAFTGISIMSF
jgi:hypothetical protein